MLLKFPPHFAQYVISNAPAYGSISQPQEGTHYNNYGQEIIMIRTQVLTSHNYSKSANF